MPAASTTEEIPATEAFATANDASAIGHIQEPSMKTLAFFTLAAVLPMLAACGERDGTATGRDASASGKPAAEKTMIGRRIEQAMDKARAELATENIDLDGVHVSGKGISIGTSNGNNGQPKAEITPQGELLIEGRKIDATPEQHALLLQYRKHVEDIALAGMDIGAAGAELGVKAATEALTGVFSGNPDRIEQRIEAEAGKIKASAMKLCDRLPAMLDTQTKLAAAMPEFRPYATMDQSDIDECYDESRTAGAQVGANVSAEVSAEIGKEIRKSIGAAMQDSGVASNGGSEATNAAAEAETASEESASRN
ncbi:MAG TPA: hypothetical protein VHF86_09740 [Xanthomonadaceae bacterium]|nr:hypothetical protein [Xanthomonadaceae bacterium]